MRIESDVIRGGIGNWERKNRTMLSGMRTVASLRLMETSQNVCETKVKLTLTRIVYRNTGVKRRVKHGMAKKQSDMWGLRLRPEVVLGTMTGLDHCYAIQWNKPPRQTLRSLFDGDGPRSNFEEG